MDAFKLSVIAAMLASLIALGVVVVVAQEAITYSTAPDVERGFVTEKYLVTDNPSANYAVSLSDGKTLYIQNNAALYNSIIENNTYLFDCRIDFTNHMLLVVAVNPQAGLVTSKVSVTDKPQISYAVNLANGRILYIANNATLYNDIAVGSTYLFDCQVNYSDNSLLVIGAQLVSASNP